MTVDEVTSDFFNDFSACTIVVGVFCLIVMLEDRLRFLCEMIERLDEYCRFKNLSTNFEERHLLGAGVRSSSSFPLCFEIIII